MQPGRLRHRIDLQTPVDQQDSFGEPITTWQDFVANVPAAIEPLAGREFYAAQQEQSDVTTRIRIRWRQGVTELMRAVHTFVIDPDTSPPTFQSDVYDIEAVLPDQRSGRRELVLMCRKRGAEGFQSGT